MDKFSWVCNECGDKEYTQAISEDDLEWLACGSCGCHDFHKEYVAKQNNAISPESTQ
jgi:hypothetical protein